jgi:hypothetical protein
LNQTFEVFLRYYINYNQDDWVQLLLIVQFVYNSTASEPITVLLFFANCRYNPTVYKQPQADKVKAQDTIVYIDKLKNLYTQLELDLQFCRQRTAEYTNKKRSQEPLLEKGDKVYLLRQNIKTKQPSRKLDFKKLGLFRVEEKISSVNYKLELPKTSRLYPVFYILLLEPAKGIMQIDKTTDIQSEQDTDVYNIEKVLASRVSKRSTEYLIK